MRKEPPADSALSIEVAAKMADITVIEALASDGCRGLDSQTALARLHKHGPNVISRREPKRIISLLANQFNSTVVLLLLAASIISMLAGELLQAAAILAAIFVNALVGFSTEYKASVSLRALEDLSGPTSRVRRNGQEFEVPASVLVPGDLVILDPGCHIPADVRLLKSGAISMDESALTGESLPVYKAAQPSSDDAESTVAFQGSLLLQGQGEALVVATGDSTRLGQLGIRLQSISSTKTPLEKNLEQLGRQLSILTVVICILLALVGIAHQENIWEMLEVSIALAVAAIPEGLAVVATLALALGTQRMVRAGVLVRKLSAVETLGCTQVICTDKTGTLTQNEMTVSDIVFDGRHLKVSGLGYTPEGAITESGSYVTTDSEPVLEWMLKAAALCNDARLESHRGQEAWHVHGDPTEGALLTVAHKADLHHEHLKERYPRIHEFPFDLGRKRMTTIHRGGHELTLAFLKGSPESILSISSSYLSASGVLPLNADIRQWFEEQNGRLAASGLRVLAVAMREVSNDSYLESSQVEDRVVLIGLVAMYDQPKPGVQEAISKCRQAGIRLIMLTGDQPATAVAIARDLNVIQPDEGGINVATGDQIAAMSDADLCDLLKHVKVLARVKPEMKYNIVKELQAAQQVVAMTGDGVNDAPALTQADIGVAMGQRGTALARDASDMVITDDNFASIVKGIQEGRGVYRNITYSVGYLLTASLSAVAVVSLAVILDFGLPFYPLQLLWLNLIMHVFPALGLVMQKASPDVMDESPRGYLRPLLDKSMFMQIGLRAAIVAGTTIAVVALFTSPDQLLRSRTLTLGTLACSLLMQSWSWFLSNHKQFSSKHLLQLANNRPMLLNSALGLLLLLAAIYVPALQMVLQTTPLSISDWILLVSAALVSFVMTLLINLLTATKPR